MGDRARINDKAYETLANACNAAKDGDVVMAWGTSFLGDLLLNDGTDMTIEGGYSADFSLRSRYTTVDGILNIGSGSLVADRVIIGPASSPPVITKQPADATVTEGEMATFDVTATGGGALEYQWLRNDSHIDGASGQIYETEATGFPDDGAMFGVVVSNATEMVMSEEALLKVYPKSGNPDGHCQIPSGAGAENIASPDRIVGNGTPESCSADAFISAVALGGKIVFNCGPKPVTITLDRPAKVFNDTGPDIVIDGGGKVTLSGGGTTRILYMNTCDPDQVWTTDHCQNQETPRLTVQNLTFINGNSRSETEYDGGGAIWVRGGRFKIVNCRFLNNTCALLGPDLGGAAVRVFSQYQQLPVFVVNSTFGGNPQYYNYGANGGGVSSIGVNWTIINSLFSYNQATGNGGNPAQGGTPGGGSGGAIYNDGNTMTLSICGTLIEHNSVNAYGSAIFFVSNNHDGTIVITDSIIRGNSGGSWYLLPGISGHSDTRIQRTNSIIE
jgi:hypothetical protein